MSANENSPFRSVKVVLACSKHKIMYMYTHILQLQAAIMFGNIKIA